MKHKTLLLIIAVALTTLAIVNASVFAYRTLQGQVSATDITTGQDETTIQNLGPACSGFYIYGASTGNTIGDSGVLPSAGTNYQSTWPSGASNWYGVKVELGDKACEWTNSGTGNTNTLYKKATVYINVTNGDWYFKDILGFGYPSGVQPSPIYVWIKVDSALSDPNIAYANLILYDSSGNQVGIIDLKSTNTYGPFTLYSGDGYQIDLDLSATGSVSNAQFTVLFYVSTSSEPPR